MWGRPACPREGPGGVPDVFRPGLWRPGARQATNVPGQEVPDAALPAGTTQV